VAGGVRRGRPDPAGVRRRERRHHRDGLPALRPGDIVILDNLSCHKTAEVARLVEAAGAAVRYLPAYSPDLNPIERLFSKLKAALRKAKARTVDALIAAMGEALRSIQPGDILGWFRHSGYGTPRSTDTPNKKPH
jgi:transposase